MMLQAVRREALELRRFYPVAPDRVWRAWVEADALREWFGQASARSWNAALDVRPGGRYRLTMELPDGTPYDAYGIYREVAEGRRLVFTWTWTAAPEAVEAVISVDLAPVEGGTEMQFRLDPMIDPRERDAWRADFRRLGHHFEKE